MFFGISPMNSCKHEMCSQALFQIVQIERERDIGLSEIKQNNNPSPPKKNPFWAGHIHNFVSSVLVLVLLKGERSEIPLSKKYPPNYSHSPGTLVGLSWIYAGIIKAERRYCCMAHQVWVLVNWWVVREICGCGLCFISINSRQTILFPY